MRSCGSSRPTLSRMKPGRRSSPPHRARRSAVLCTPPKLVAGTTRRRSCSQRSAMSWSASVKSRPNRRATSAGRPEHERDRRAAPGSGRPTQQDVQTKLWRLSARWCIDAANGHRASRGNGAPARFPSDRRPHPSASARRSAARAGPRRVRRRARAASQRARSSPWCRCSQRSRRPTPTAAAREQWRWCCLRRPALPLGVQRLQGRARRRRPALGSSRGLEPQQSGTLQHVALPGLSGRDEPLVRPSASGSPRPAPAPRSSRRTAVRPPRLAAAPSTARPRWQPCRTRRPRTGRPPAGPAPPRTPTKSGLRTGRRFTGHEPDHDVMIGAGEYRPRRQGGSLLPLAEPGVNRPCRLPYLEVPSRQAAS